ncbi:hypothetical protein B0T14DRAFT_522168 [Immersiella caudata]|uniref:Uncharacterized protein n=1 Tax=Immersiella caudata TaxID=314043 RepID=A0AA39WSJ2_9PEZI|nr:hypothetical protein B0T14DRAFT_522168 [Immersiella caudata]
MMMMLVWGKRTITVYFLWVEQPAHEHEAPQEQESPHILMVVCCWLSTSRKFLF